MVGFSIAGIVLLSSMDYEEDVTNEFLSRGIACVGWNESVTPALYNMMAHIKVGDIIYIKSHPINWGLIH